MYESYPNDDIISLLHDLIYTKTWEFWWETMSRESDVGWVPIPFRLPSRGSTQEPRPH